MGKFVDNIESKSVSFVVELFAPAMMLLGGVVVSKWAYKLGVQLGLS